MNKIEAFIRRNSSTILSVTASIGVVVTAVLAVKATPKALELIEESKKDNPDMSKLDIIKVAWKPYIPSFLMGFSTISCIFGANYLNKRVQTSLISAYAMLDRSYKQYREKCIEMYNVDTDIDIRRKIAQSNYYKNIEIDDDCELFFDFTSMQYFESTLDKVKEALDTINITLAEGGFVYLNDFYEVLGVPLFDYGYNLGWFSSEGPLEMDYEKVELDDGLECWIITPSRSPVLYLY